ncbi:MAG: 16S rRNA (cytosine(1402)-N(4))-methyltransferase RsmH [Candidatus Promineifilaceae bacterium]
MSVEHVPVLYQEVLEYLRPEPGRLYIDGTVGAGGHAAGLLQASAPDGRLLAFDRDPEAISFSRRRLAQFENRVVFVQASYAEMADLAPKNGFEKVDGILLDIGLSSRQLEDAERGFSFMHDGKLDMRFDTTSGRSAADLLNSLSEVALADIFWRYGEVRQSRRFARAIIHQRPIETTGQLAELILQESGGRRGRIHPATQVFQALRIAVNDELGMLERGLEAAVRVLNPGGRLAVISFHSLEDRLVKNFIRNQSRDCICPPEQPFCTCDAQPTLKAVTRKVVRPSEEEVAENPRSRSAKMRVAGRLDEQR